MLAGSYALLFLVAGTHVFDFESVVGTLSIARYFGVLLWLCTSAGSRSMHIRELVPVWIDLSVGIQHSKMTLLMVFVPTTVVFRCRI